LQTETKPQFYYNYLDADFEDGTDEKVVAKHLKNDIWEQNSNEHSTKKKPKNRGLVVMNNF